MVKSPCRKLVIIVLAALTAGAASSVCTAAPRPGVILGRTEPRLFSDFLDMPGAAISLVVGGIPILRLPISGLIRFGLILVDAVVAFYLLMLSGWSIDCYFFHECD